MYFLPLPVRFLACEPSRTPHVRVRLDAQPSASVYPVNRAIRARGQCRSALAAVWASGLSSTGQGNAGPPLAALLGLCPAFSPVWRRTRNPQSTSPTPGTLSPTATDSSACHPRAPDHLHIHPSPFCRGSQPCAASASSHSWIIVALVYTLAVSPSSGFGARPHCRQNAPRDWLPFSSTIFPPQ